VLSTKGDNTKLIRAGHSRRAKAKGSKLPARNRRSRLVRDFGFEFVRASEIDSTDNFALSYLKDFNDEGRKKEEKPTKRSE
jgi:hypothetical protein